MQYFFEEYTKINFRIPSDSSFKCKIYTIFIYYRKQKLLETCLYLGKNREKSTALYITKEKKNDYDFI